MKLSKRLSQVQSTSSLMSQRKGIIADYLPWLIIGIAVLAIIFIAIFLLRGQGESLIDKIKDLFGGV